MMPDRRPAEVGTAPRCEQTRFIRLVRCGVSAVALLDAESWSVASLDDLDVIPKSMLVRRLGTLGPGADSLICNALEAMADC